MPILNYTTKISASKTIGEIQEILASHGAKKIICDYDDHGTPSAVSFALLMNGQMVFFSLPARYEGVLKAMKRQRVKNSLCTPEQSVRTAWRNIKDWIQAQCALIDAGLAEMPEIFLPFAVTKEGSTLYSAIQQNTQLLLSSKIEP